MNFADFGGKEKHMQNNRGFKKYQSRKSWVLPDIGQNNSICTQKNRVIKNYQSSEKFILLQLLMKNRDLC